ncbi:hypothetical protein L208DRAFT_1273464, partial [Tricholoma matsutake]
AGGKIPVDSDAILKKAFLCMAYTIKDQSIPSELITNSDQTQMALAQSCHMTYAKVGSKQVTTIGTEEKCTITIMVTLTNDGVVLPFQLIRCLRRYHFTVPQKNSMNYKDAKATGFLLETSKTSTYWSTQETMRNFVNTILTPHFDAKKIHLGLPPDQCSLWQIDCWSVHRSDEFINWMGKSHESIIVYFIPAQ